MAEVMGFPMKLPPEAMLNYIASFSPTSVIFFGEPE